MCVCCRAAMVRLDCGVGSDMSVTAIARITLVWSIARLLLPTCSTDEFNDLLNGCIRTAGTELDLTSIILANDAVSSPGRRRFREALERKLAALLKFTTVCQIEISIAYDETDSLVLVHRSEVEHRTLYHISTNHCVFICGNKLAGCENLQSVGQDPIEDPKFQLGVVAYECSCEQQNDVQFVSIQSTVDEENPTTAWFLCASPDMRRGDEYADVTVKQMESVPDVPKSKVKIELDPNEGRFFLAEICRSKKTLRLRSTVSGPYHYYLAVTEDKTHKSETLNNNDQCLKLCMKRFSSNDNDKTDPEIEFSWNRE